MEELFLEVYGFEGMWMHVHVFLILKFVNVTSNSEGEARARTYWEVKYSAYCPQLEIYGGLKTSQV